MAGIEIMAEGASPGPEVAAGVQTGADISSSVEVVRQAGGIPESVKRQQAMKLQLGGEPPEQGKPEEVDKTSEGGTEEKKTDGENQEKKRSRRGSLFEQARKKFEGLQDELEDVELTEDERSAFEKDLEESLADIVHLFNEGEQFVDEEGKKIGILTFFRDDVRRIYLEATAQPPPSSDSDWYPSPTTKNSQERIYDVYKALGWKEETNEFRYEERFWGYGDVALSVIRDRDGNPVDPRILKSAFRGMASFLAPKVALAIEKRLKGIPVDHERDFGDLYLVDIERELEETNEEREQDRKEKRKRATAKERLHYNNWRERFDFTWAEDVDELRDTIHDWLEIFARQIPRESAEKVNESIQRGRTNSISALEAAAHRIGIEKGSTIYIELQDTIEGHVDAISGVEMQNRKGGLEAHTAYLEDFANNFNGHHDAIYLRPKSVLIQHFLSRNDGEAFLGGPSTLEKPMGGNVKEHKSQKEWEAKMYAYTHELYISEDDFKNAVTQKAAFEKSVREEVAKLNIPAENIETEVKQRLDQKMAAFEADIRQEVEELYLSQEVTKQEIRRRLGEKLGRYGWYDTVEELLLEDSRGKEKARNELGDYRQMTETIEQEVAGLGLPPDRVQQEISQRVIEEIRKLANNDADEFNDVMADYQERWNKRKEGLVKVEARTGVFRTIKERLDKRDGLFGKSTEERRNIIRSRIKDKMRKEKRYKALLTEIEAIPDQEAQDRALWKWVKEFNDFRQKTKGGTEHDSGVSTPDPWFPTSWDTVRLSINKTGKLADRALTRDQLEAMIEEVDDPYINLTDDQIRKQIRIEFIDDIKKEIGAEGIAEDQVAGELRVRLKRKESDIAKKINNVLFNQQQRLTDAVREYNINRVYAKFIGLEARLGGLTVRTLDKDGKLVMRTIASVARDIIKAKIDWEAAIIEKKVEIHGEALAQKRDAQNNPAYTQEQIGEQKNKKRRELRRKDTFGSVLALREIGIANDLALTEYSFYGHTEQIQAFTELVEWDHTDKKFLPEFLDRPRREEEATMNFLAQQFMDGKYLIIRDNPDLDPEYEYEVELDSNNQPKIDPETKKKVYKLDEFDMPIPKRNPDGSLEVLEWYSDHKEAFDRARVINSGGELALRDLFESRFMVSTSGGVKVADLISKVGDLGIRDLLWEYGCWDMREFQGFIKRRDEVELQDQTFWNTEKWAAPISYAQRLRGAIAARVHLVGGELKGVGKVLGLLNEPLNGAWRFRDEFFNMESWLDLNTKDLVGETKTVSSVSAWKDKMRKKLEEGDATKLLTDTTRDKLVSLAGDIFKHVLDYMTARDYVRNRAGFAPKNWQYDNTVILEGIFEEYAKRSPVFALANEILFADSRGRKILAEAGDVVSTEGEEMLGDQHLSYAPEGRTKAARALFKMMLQGSTYHVLDEADSRILAMKGKEVRNEMAAKRNKLLAKIMPEDKITAMREKEEKLKGNAEKKIEGEVDKLKKMQAEFVALVKKGEGEKIGDRDFSNKVVDINEKREVLRQKNKDIKAEEVQIATDMNKIVQDKLDEKSQAGTLTNEEAELRSMITGRRQELARMGAKPELGNIELEINRIINQYIDYQLHMQFPGEWSTRVADIAA